MGRIFLLQEMQKHFQHINYEVSWKDTWDWERKKLFWEQCKWMEESTTKHFENNTKSRRMKPLWQNMMLA
jgi:hypothetical protein